MTHEILPIYRTGLLAVLDVKLGNKPVYGIKRDRFPFKWSKIPKLLRMFMLTAHEHGAPHASLWNSASTDGSLA